MRVVLEEVKLAESTIEPVENGRAFGLALTVVEAPPGVAAADGVTLECRAAGYGITPPHVSFDAPGTKVAQVTLSGPAGDGSATVVIRATAGDVHSCSVSVRKVKTGSP